jgi:hypothetical protein
MRSTGQNMRCSSVLLEKKAQGRQPAGLSAHAAIRAWPDCAPATRVDRNLYPLQSACHTYPAQVQAKLAVNRPGDRYEQEADRIADQVMRMSEPRDTEKTESAGTANGATISMQREPTDQAEPTGVPTSVDQVLRSPSQPLDPATRAFMEPRFGHDFSQVRVHVDTKSAASARAVNALAYTVGQDIVFATGQYQPKPYLGWRLIAHELSHVMQQRANSYPEGAIMQRWGAEDHQKLTRDGYDEFFKVKSVLVHPELTERRFRKNPWFIESVAKNAGVLDARAKKLFWTGPAYLLSIRKGEESEHGEDDDYSSYDEKAACDKNKAAQDRYRDLAVECYEDVVRGGESLEREPREYEKVVVALGNACHIAQDRGAHREGVKGRGHDDPREKKGRWSADDPSFNRDGRKEAVGNTKELFLEYLTRIPSDAEVEKRSAGEKP